MWEMFTSLIIFLAAYKFMNEWSETQARLRRLEKENKK